MRVLHVGKFFPPDRGGMESFLAELVLAQQAQGLEVYALVHGRPEEEDPAWLRRVPVQFALIYTPIALGFRQALAQAIEEWQPDVLHLHLPNVAVFWTLTLPEARSLAWVVHWHSDVVVSSNSPLALRLAYTFYRPLEQAVLEQADRIIATSETYLLASEPLQDWRYKCAAIPLGISAEYPDLSSAGSFTLPWCGHGLRLLSVGRLAHYKGFETLVRAVMSVPELELVIAGDGEAMPKLRALVESMAEMGQPSSKVHLLGAVSEEAKHALMQSCDVFCLASRERTEAFGVVLLEAMAHGRPCVVADLAGSGMPWVVKEAGAGIHHLPVDDVGAWSRELAGLKDRRADLQAWGLQGRLSLERIFSIESCAKAINGQYAHHRWVKNIDSQYRLALSDPWEAPAQHKVLIVIPARDEALTIGGLIESLKRFGWTDVLVIDDQSQDQTASLARKAGARVVSPVLPLGAWGGMQLGIRHAMAEGYEAVITMDADGQHEVPELHSLTSVAHEADVVIGAHPQRVSIMRRWAWRWFRLITGVDVQDLTSGFRYYNRSAMALLAGAEATLLDYQDVGVLILLRRSGLSVKEIAVNMAPRQSGKSRIFYSWSSVAGYMLSTSLLCLSRWKSPARNISHLDQIAKF